MVGFTALALVVLVASGCGGESASNREASDISAQICTEFTATNDRHLANETPEGKAYSDAMEAAYVGDRVAYADLPRLRRLHFESWHREITLLAEQAEGGGVRQAIEAYADSLQSLAAQEGTSGGANALVDTKVAVDKACGRG
ncbi:hypothetical protein [Micromonospora sp. NBC_01796]|uniref:hypothetical protein n=1 Tax=Micromonospora sp. NBC_01796 TaxID=2975987 RepID=UPI002DDC5521|nr:hypothetical protein [Micromonospora sp. NBC_01796]WSA85169.1 hypothetical protein OIE47_33230 [Micromonospora sp. NBC_01796]